jgi:hypothetical protein
MPGIWKQIKGTLETGFRIGFLGPFLKASGSNLILRNPGDTADVALTASTVNVSGDAIKLNSDAAGTGADWQFDLLRPTTGMTANQAFRFPAGNGSSGQVIVTDGAGNHSYATAATTADKTTNEVTAFTFGTTSPLTMFTLPANAMIEEICVYVDTAFNGTPSISIGVSGTVSKYAPASVIDLNSAGQYVIYPGVVPIGTAEALIATYSAGGATAGVGRILVKYSIPT